MAKPLLVSDLELAKHWSMTDRRVRQLAEEGIAVRVGTKFDLIESDRKLIEWLRRDEETSRAKRRKLAFDEEVAAKKLARMDREYLTPDEIHSVMLQGWSHVQRSHTGALSALYRNIDWIVRQPPDSSAKASEMLAEIARESRAELMQGWELVAAELGDMRERLAGELRLRRLAAERTLRATMAEFNIDAEDFEEEPKPERRGRKRRDEDLDDEIDAEDLDAEHGDE